MKKQRNFVGREKSTFLKLENGTETMYSLNFNSLQTSKIGDISKGSCFLRVTRSVDIANIVLFFVSITKTELSIPMNLVPR